MINNYLEEIIEKVSFEIKEAAFSDNEKGFDKFILFLRGDVVMKSFNNDLVIFTSIVKIPGLLYPNLPVKYRSRLIELYTIRFAELAAVYSYSTNPKIEYLDNTYIGLLNLIKEIIKYNSSSDFNLLFKNLKGTMYNYESDNLNIEYKRYFFLVVFSWLLYNYKEGLIENILEYDLNLVDEILWSNDYLFADKYYTNSFIRLVNKAQSNFWGLDYWDNIKDRYDGNTHFSLSSRDWLFFGFAVLSFRKRLFLSQNNIELNKIDLKEYTGFENDILSPLLSDVKSNFDKYSPLIFDNYLIDNLKTQYKTILEESELKTNAYFDFVKKEKDLDYSKQVALVPLSKSKIDNFKELIGSAFYSNNLILSILNYYSRTVSIANDTTVNGIGYFTTLYKGKVAFIDGEHYTNIMGISDLGSSTARSLNNNFISEISRKAKRENIKLDDCLSELSKIISSFINRNEYIILSPLRNFNRLFPYDKINVSDIPFAYGTLNDVPIFPYYSSNNSIYLFSINDILYEIYESPDWYKNQLLIKVDELNDIQIEARLKELDKKSNKEKDKILNLTMEEQKVFERASVNIKIIFKANVKISDSAKIYRFDVI